MPVLSDHSTQAPDDGGAGRQETPPHSTIEFSVNATGASDIVVTMADFQAGFTKEESSMELLDENTTVPAYSVPGNNVTTEAYSGNGTSNFPPRVTSSLSDSTTISTENVTSNIMTQTQPVTSLSTSSSRKSREPNKNVVIPKGFKGFRNLTFQSPPRRVTIKPVRLGHGDRNPIALPIISYYGREEEKSKEKTSTEEGREVEMGVVQVPFKVSTQGPPDTDKEAGNEIIDQTTSTPDIETQSNLSSALHSSTQVISYVSSQPDLSSQKTLLTKEHTSSSQVTTDRPSLQRSTTVAGTSRTSQVTDLETKSTETVTKSALTYKVTVKTVMNAGGEKEKTQGVGVNVQPTLPTLPQESVILPTTTSARGIITTSSTKLGADKITTKAASLTTTLSPATAPETTVPKTITATSFSEQEQPTSKSNSTTKESVTRSMTIENIGVKIGPEIVPTTAINEKSRETTSKKETIKTSTNKAPILSITTVPTHLPRIITESPLKSPNVTTAGSPLVLEGGTSNLLMILIPALISGIALVVGLLAVVMIYRRKCGNTAKYRKTDDEEELNAVLEEKVYLELIYAKVDLSKKTRLRYGESGEESTPLTLEDSSNNNNTLNNKEQKRKNKPNKDNILKSSSLPRSHKTQDAVYSNSSFENVYENAGTSCKRMDLSLPVKSISPKTSPSRARSPGKFFSRASPGSDKKRQSPGTSKKSPRSASKKERKISVSPERTPKSRRSSPSPKKLRTPPSPKVGAGCWQSPDSEEETYQNTGKPAVVIPPVDYKDELSPTEEEVHKEATRKQPVACTSTCNGSCGGACGGAAPHIPEKPPSAHSTRKDLPQEPLRPGTSGTTTGATEEGNYSVVGDLMPTPASHLSNLDSMRSSGLSHSYDPVYVPRSDANAMSRRLDNAGYVTSKLQRVIARGGTEMDILTSVRDNRPIPTIIGPPIMRRKPASRTGSERSTASHPSTSSSQDNPQNHVYSCVEGERNSSSTVHESSENVYADVKVCDIGGSDVTTTSERIYDDPAELAKNSDDDVNVASSSEEEKYANVPSNVYYSSPVDNVDSPEPTLQCQDDPYEMVLFRN